jgi:hypothetical protein
VSDLPTQDADEPKPAAPQRRGRLWLLVVLAVLVGGSVWLWQAAQAATRADWRLVVDERFDDPLALSKGWRAVLVPEYRRIEAIHLGGSGWRVEGGALVGDDRQGRISNLARVDLPGGALRASWTITPQVSGLNLNCFVGAPNRLDGYTIHVGGWGRPDYLAVGRANGALLDSCTLGDPLRPGQTYRLGLEFDLGSLRFSIDGRELLACRDPEPISGSEQGGLGFEVSWNTVRIDDVQIWVRPQPRLVSPLAVADSLASAGAFGRAAAAYQGFVRTWPDDPLVPVARLRGAVAQVRAGFPDEALPVLSELAAHRDPAVSIQARYERLLAMAAQAPDDILDGLIARLAELRPDGTVARLALTTASDALFARSGDASAEQVIEVVARLRRWSSALGVDRNEEILARCAGSLNRLGRHEEVITLVPEPAVQHAEALLALARYDEIHQRFPGIQWARYMAWSDTCRYEDAIGQLSEPFLLGRLMREAGAGAGDPRLTSDFDRAFALAQERGVAEALEQFPKEGRAIAFALLGQGRAEHVLTVPEAGDPARALALLQLGRYDEAAGVIPAGGGPQAELRACTAIAALAAGDAAAARTQATVPATWSWSYESRWPSHVYDPNFTHHFAAFVLPALIAWQSTGADPLPAWRQLAAEQRKRSSLRVDHRWLALLGAAGPEAIMAQPFRSGGHPLREAAMVTAVRADLAGDPATVARWRSYLEVASPFDTAARAWARLRLQQLGAQDAPTAPPAP